MTKHNAALSILILASLLGAACVPLRSTTAAPATPVLLGSTGAVPAGTALETGDSFISGRVWKQGREQAGVNVYVMPDGAGPGGVIAQAMTNEAGIFSVRVPSGRYNVVASDPASRQQSVTWHVQAASVVDIQLTPTGSIGGRVTGGKLNDYAGLEVYIPGTQWIGMTDSAGGFTIDNVPVGTYSLTVKASGATCTPVEVSVPVAAMATASLQIVTTPWPYGYGTIQGHVSLSDGGDPAGTVVEAGSPQGLFATTSITVGSDGAYSIPSLQCLYPVRLIAHRSGYADAVSGDTTLLTAGQTLTVDLRPMKQLSQETLLGPSLGFRDHLDIAASALAGTDSGLLYIAESSANYPYVSRILRLDTQTGTLETLLGGASIGLGGNPGAAALLNEPQGLALDGEDRLWISDAKNYRIRQASLTDGSIRTLAGWLNGFADGYGSAAKFAYPMGLALDGAGSAYVADRDNHKIRLIGQDGTVSTFAGSSASFVNAQGTAAGFRSPISVVRDGNGLLYVADTGNHALRKITSNGTVSTLAGSTIGSADGTGSAAQFNAPTGLATVGGYLYCADRDNHRIRCILTSSGAVSTLAGSTQGLGDGTGTGARFNAPQAVAMAGGDLYVADTGNRRLRKIDLDTGLVTTQATGGIAVLNNPQGLARATDGTLYVADTTSGRVLAVNPTTHAVTVVAGGSSAGYLDGAGPVARFNAPRGLALDESGNLYVADTGNARIRKIVLATGEVSTLAGSTQGLLDAHGTSAKFHSPYGLALDGAGNLYVSDAGNHRIRQIVLATQDVTTLAGGNGAGFENGPNSSALFNSPRGMVYNAASQCLYVADSLNFRIRRIVLATGQVSTLAGSGTLPAGLMPTLADGTPGIAQFANPANMVLANDGYLYVTDHLVYSGGSMFAGMSLRRVDPATGVVTTLATFRYPAGTYTTRSGDYESAGPMSIASDNARLLLLNPVDNRLTALSLP